MKNDGGLIPLKREEPLHILHLVMSSDARVDNMVIQGIPEAELAARRVPTDTVWLGPEVSDATAERILERSAGYTHVLASAFVKVGAFRGNADMSEAHAALLEALVSAGRKVIVVSYGSPYLLHQFPDVPAYVCSYGWVETSQRAAISALFGEQPVDGPPPGHAAGAVRLRAWPADSEARDDAARRAVPSRRGSGPTAWRSWTTCSAPAVAERRFPGGVAAVGKDGALVHTCARSGSSRTTRTRTPVATDTLYDLASLDRRWW